MSLHSEHQALPDQQSGCCIVDGGLYLGVGSGESLDLGISRVATTFGPSRLALKYFMKD